MVIGRSDPPGDLDSGERRGSTEQDIINTARLIDQLPNYDFSMSYGIPGDCDADKGDLHQFAAQVVNCAKPIVFTALSEKNVRIILEMAAVAVGSDRPASQSTLRGKSGA